MLINKAKYVWYEKQGCGRNLYGMFRKTFELSGKVTCAELNIFADTHYQLFINGAFIEFGPVRFDPRFPLYDTHNITPYLREGINVIAVLVNNFGCKTYKAIKNDAGFIAWGTLQSDHNFIDLSTYNGSWICLPAKAYSRYASKLSFALNPSELYDQSLEERGWKEIDYNDENWLPVVEIDHQDAWGELSPRLIPFMSGEAISVVGNVDIFPILSNDEIHSFSVDIPHFFEDNKEDYCNLVMFSTWIYSPIEQKLPVGVFWGDGWINGNPLPKGVDSWNKSMRITQTWDLKQGWNYYFGKVGVYFDALYQYFAVPKGKGIIFSADRDGESSYAFKHSPVLSVKGYNEYLMNKVLPYDDNETLNEVGGWIYKSKQDVAHSPSRETSWDDYGDAVERMNVADLNGHLFSVKDYPNGFAFTLDLEFMHLFFTSLRMEGVKGATIDLTYTEHLSNDKIHFKHMHHHSIGDRILCSRNTLDWIGVHPRGARYLKVTVRDLGEDITIKALELRLAGYPVKRKGYFQCSDPCLNEIWSMGARTLEANMEDAYVDCSGRERGMYARDTVIQYYVNLATYGDHALMQRCMELYGQSADATGKFRAVYPNTGDYTISDFSLNLLEGYYTYYKNTGDINRISKDWEVMMSNLNWFNHLAEERADLLMDSEWHLKKSVNSLYGGFHGDLGILEGYLDNTGIHCVFSCTYLIALKCAEELAVVIGKAEDHKNIQSRIRILEKSIPKTFWNEELGCFSDNLERSSHSAHASLFAIRACIVNEKQLKAIREYISNNLKSVFVNGYDPKDGVYFSPHFAFYIFDGLYKAELADVAVRLMKDGWGWILSKGLRTCPEYFDMERSLCHAWSASPTYYLSRYVLGVSYPNEPSMDMVEINVKAEGIEYAEGAYPHPKGLIEVKWHLNKGERIFDYVKVPQGVRVTIIG
jgi:hypothetical protein